MSPTQPRLPGIDTTTDYKAIARRGLAAARAALAAGRRDPDLRNVAARRRALDALATVTRSTAS